MQLNALLHTWSSCSFLVDSRHTQVTRIQLVFLSHTFGHISEAFEAMSYVLEEVMLSLKPHYPITH